MEPNDKHNQPTVHNSHHIPPHYLESNGIKEEKLRNTVSQSHLSNNGHNQNDNPEESDPNKKPPYSYVAMITMAIESSEFKQLPLRAIYNYIMNRFPYYKKENVGWQNSIRHNLSLNDCFEKKPRDVTQAGQRKGNDWIIADAYKNMFENGNYKRRKKIRKTTRTTHDYTRQSNSISRKRMVSYSSHHLSGSSYMHATNGSKYYPTYHHGSTHASASYATSAPYGNQYSAEEAFAWGHTSHHFPPQIRPVNHFQVDNSGFHTSTSGLNHGSAAYQDLVSNPQFFAPNISSNFGPLDMDQINAQSTSPFGINVDDTCADCTRHP